MIFAASPCVVIYYGLRHEKHHCLMALLYGSAGTLLDYIHRFPLLAIFVDAGVRGLCQIFRLPWVAINLFQRPLTRHALNDLF